MRGALAVPLCTCCPFFVSFPLQHHKPAHPVTAIDSSGAAEETRVLSPLANAV